MVRESERVGQSQNGTLSRSREPGGGGSSRVTWGHRLFLEVSFADLTAPWWHRLDSGTRYWLALLHWAWPRLCGDSVVPDRHVNPSLEPADVTLAAYG